MKVFDGNCRPVKPGTATPSFKIVYDVFVKSTIAPPEISIPKVPSPAQGISSITLRVTLIAGGIVIET